MTGRSKFPGLTENLSPGCRARIEACKIELREEMALHELRKDLGTLQAALAVRLDVNQPATTRMERRAQNRAEKGSPVVRKH